MKQNIFMLSVVLLSVVVLDSTVSALQEQQQQQQPLQVPGTSSNYVIKFFGIKHDYQNVSEAKSLLADKLQTLTGYPIVVDFLDSTDGTAGLATWYATNVTDCAEQEVNRLLEKIRLPDGSLTREYKMLFNEQFIPPSRVEVEWLGLCENLGRKRAMPASPQDVSTTTTATTTVEAIPPSMPTTSLAPELPPPTTTTEPAPTTTTMINTNSLQSVTETTEASLFDMDPVTTTQAPPTTTTMATTTTTMTTTTTTSTEPPTTTTTTEPTTTSTTTQLPTTTSTTTEIPLPPPTTVTTNTDPIESAPVVAPDNAASSAKYIGLGAAFGLSIVYLICARAYRRQGMYELNTETREDGHC